MLGNSGSYANKKRKKPVLKQKKPTKCNEVVKSNPSKRHRERLNGELDRLTDLLPFSEDIRSRLDKLSVLRLSVGYLRVKSYFSASTKTRNNSLTVPGVKRQIGKGFDTTSFSEGDLLLQALNGFIIVVTSQGSVFYVSATVKDYLGFQESDVVHQSVFELIHTDDRALFKQQLHFALHPPANAADEDDPQSCSNAIMYSPEQLPPENSSFLERSFVCRFRCLLDNSSGFLALMFQGRLKYLHGQAGVRGNGVCNKSQLALFSIAMPVQPPSIVEIRAKMLLFQTKHKLDFTPMGIDTRGKIILGYSEMELCMRGSGYQFVHAADMMHCADTHTRMMKTGETGLTVFRLLRKSGNWQWVKANAKLFFKGGRPDFIISYQKALSNAEGEEHLRRRGLKPPFSFSGEAVLYSSSPSLDVSQVQFNKMFYEDDVQKDVLPGSLLDSFLKQDESAYTQAADLSLPMDAVFQDSRALLSVPSDSWQESGNTAANGAPMVMKEDAKQSVMNVMDKLEKLVENGELCSVLQNLDVADSELMEWEHTVTRLRQEEDRQDNLSAELDGILTNDIFDYIDSVLFTGKGGNGLGASPPSYLAAVGHHQQRPEPTSFLTASSDCTFSPPNGIYAPRRDAMNGTLSPGETVKILPHCPPLVTQADAKPPPLQQLQLPDIFTASIELPQITLPGAAEHDGSLTHQTRSSRLLVCPENKFQPPAAAGSGHYLQSSATQPHNAAPGLGGVLPSLVPCSSFNSSGTPNGPIPYATSCLQRSPPAGGMQNGHEPMLACHSQTPESQTLPRAGLWPVGVTRPTQHGGLACGQASTPVSGAFDMHFSCSPAGGGVLALSASGQRGTDVSLDESPPQGSCYFHWGHSKPAVGTSSIAQESANVSPLTAPSSLAFNVPHFLECGGQTPLNMSHCGLDPFNQQENYERN